MDECGEKNAISLSWGRREIRISGEGTTLYVNGVPHDMTMMLEAIRGAGARPERISPARWISLLRGRPTVLPGCESPLVMVRVPFRIYGQVSVSGRGKGTLLPGGNAVIGPDYL